MGKFIFYDNIKLLIDKGYDYQLFEINEIVYMSVMIPHLHNDYEIFFKLNEFELSKYHSDGSTYIEQLSKEVRDNKEEYKARSTYIKLGEYKEKDD